MGDTTPQVCQWCTLPLVGKRRDARHCSKRCSNLAWYHKNKKLAEQIERCCPICDEPIPLSAHANRIFCSQSCQNRMRQYSQYGLTRETFDSLLAEQGGVCAICRCSDLWSRGGDRGWHIDHDHESGRVRGVLCPYCNLMLGYAKDRPLTLEAAAEYLRTK